MKVAVLCAGQGSQYNGMGAAFYAGNETYRQTIEQLDASVSFDLIHLLNEENELLDQTAYTQPAIVAMTVGIGTALEQAGIQADYFAGLSLGEYSALTLAKAIEPTAVIPLVHLRGQLMQAAAPGIGAMAAVLGIERSVIADVCSETPGIVEIANYNCPGQIVIGGEKQAVERASETLKALGARRVLPLNVSGPFHTSLLAPAAQRLAPELAKIQWKKPNVPVVRNVDAKPYEDTFVYELAKQVESSVYWEDSVRYLLDQGVDTFIEIGPGKILTGFVKKIDRTVKTYTIETPEQLDSVKEQLLP
ncbi:MAG: ACP S-malonyltransferase [Culicoidibacterales bacterium]